MKGFVIFLVGAVLICGFLYWWSTRLDRCLAREGYWAWSGTRYGSGECKQQSGPMFPLSQGRSRPKEA